MPAAPGGSEQGQHGEAEQDDVTFNGRLRVTVSAMPLRLSTFDEHLSGDSALSIVLRGHLYVEGTLNTILEIVMARPDAMKIDRLGFRQKLDLVDAFGLLGPDLVTPLRELNRLRNRLAHNLDGEPTPEEISDLITGTRGPVRESYQAVVALGPPHDGTSNPAGPTLDLLRTWFFSLVMLLDFQAQLREYEKIYQTQIMQFHAIKYRDPDASDEAVRDFVGLPAPPDPRQAWVS
jgi:hypothetical protein